jgi:outer membrane protein
MQNKKPWTALTLPATILMLALLLAAPAPATEGPGGLSMQQAVDTALRQSPELAESKGRVDELRAARDEIHAQFRPDVYLEASYTYFSNPPETTIDVNLPVPGFTPPKLQMGYQDNYLLSLKASQIIYSGALYYGFKAVDKQVQAGELQDRAARIAVARMTAEAYLNALLAKESLAAREQALADAEDHLDQARKRYELGAGPEMDVIRAQMEADTIRQQVEDSRRILDSARTMLGRAMGEDIDGMALTDQLETPIVKTAEAEALARAEKDRPDLAALSVSRDAALAQGRARKGTLEPTAQANAAYNYQKPYYQINDWDDNLALSIGVRVPLYDGGEAKAGVARAQAQARTIASTTARTRADLQAEIHNNVAAIDEASRNIELARQNVERAQRLVGIVRQSYQIGAVTGLQVIDAQLAAANARLAQLKVYYDYRVARVRLAAAMGDLEGIR